MPLNLSQDYGYVAFISPDVPRDDVHGELLNPIVDDEFVIGVIKTPPICPYPIIETSRSAGRFIDGVERRLTLNEPVLSGLVRVEGVGIDDYNVLVKASKVQGCLIHSANAYDQDISSKFDFVIDKPAINLGFMSGFGVNAIFPTDIFQLQDGRQILVDGATNALWFIKLGDPSSPLENVGFSSGLGLPNVRLHAGTQLIDGRILLADSSNGKLWIINDIDTPSAANNIIDAGFDAGFGFNSLQITDVSQLKDGRIIICLPEHNMIYGVDLNNVARGAFSLGFTQRFGGTFLATPQDAFEMINGLIGVFDFLQRNLYSIDINNPTNPAKDIGFPSGFGVNSTSVGGGTQFSNGRTFFVDTELDNIFELPTIREALKPFNNISPMQNIIETSSIKLTENKSFGVIGNASYLAEVKYEGVWRSGRRNKIC